MIQPLAHMWRNKPPLARDRLADESLVESAANLWAQHRDDRVRQRLAPVEPGMATRELGVDDVAALSSHHGTQHPIGQEHAGTFPGSDVHVDAQRVRWRLRELFDEPAGIGTQATAAVVR